MNEAFDKIFERLEELKLPFPDDCHSYHCNTNDLIDKAKGIVQEVEEECTGTLLDELIEAKTNCGEYSDCSQCIFGQDEYACNLQELQITDKNNGWIPCSERLPEEKINPVTKDYYEYPVTYKNNDVEDIRYYKFGNGHWYHGFQIMDDYVTAWQPLPEPYKESEG